MRPRTKWKPPWQPPRVRNGSGGQWARSIARMPCIVSPPGWSELSPTAGECLTREMGKPYRESHWEIGASASSFRYYAELARHDQGRVSGPVIAGQLQMTIKEPLGTVVSIVPFNFPVLLFGWQARRRWQPATRSSSSRPNSRR